MLSAASNDAAIKIAVRRIGPALVFPRIGQERSLDSSTGALVSRSVISLLECLQPFSVQQALHASRRLDEIDALQGAELGYWYIGR